MSRPVTYLFPACLMANIFAMTGVMIVLALMGNPELAADFGIVHGATLALFFAFSGNARNFILNPESTVSVGDILSTRTLLVVPLGAISFLLSAHFAGVDALLAFILVIRRGAEWIAEVHVSEMEMRQDTQPASRFFACQVTLTGAVVLWALGGLPGVELAIFVWATSPLWIRCGHIRWEKHIPKMTVNVWSRLLPHFGSSAVIGVTVYVFRLLILLLVGKTVAGDLYTAFAIGGLLASVFAQAIGPTVMLHQARAGEPITPSWLRVATSLSLVFGAVLSLGALGESQLLGWTGKSSLFWLATGLSLIGGAVMITAWQYRLRILQQNAEGDVFGPDVLANILIVALIPYLFYLFGTKALAPLYLISSGLALAFYFSAAKAADLWAGKAQSWGRPVRSIIALLIFFPLFFELTGTVFRDPAYLFDTGGRLMHLPIPVSVIGCAGIVVLARYIRAHASLATIFFTFTLMLISSVTLTQLESVQQEAKLILAIQLILPMFALVLGQMYEEEKESDLLCAKVFLWVLALIVPMQLVATWIRGHPLLSPYLYAFSVYQHLQYVPVIFVAGYLLALYSLWPNRPYRIVLVALAAPMGIYMAASLSVLAAVALSAGVLGFAARERAAGTQNSWTWVLFAIIVLSMLAYRPVVNSGGLFTGNVMSGPLSDAEIIVPLNVLERLHYWSFYAEQVFRNLQSATLGHVAPPDRNTYPSAHNYYLDFAYNFGLIALLPILFLIAVTLAAIYRRRRIILAQPGLLGLTAIVLFLILVDNSLKVGMRQPYPGIFTFFLWGVLLSRLKLGSPDANRASFTPSG